MKEKLETLLPVVLLAAVLGFVLWAAPPDFYSDPPAPGPAVPPGLVTPLHQCPWCTDPPPAR
jgi:hypothetical protein